MVADGDPKAMIKRWRYVRTLQRHADLAADRLSCAAGATLKLAVGGDLRTFDLAESAADADAALRARRLAARSRALHRLRV